MFIELTEVLYCPACEPGQGLVARVDRQEGRRVLEGFLGCPVCETRYPVRAGVVRFAPGRERTAGTAATSGSDDPRAARSSEPPSVVAALLGLPAEGSGYVLLGRGLAAVAEEVARLAPEVEIVTLGDPSPAADRELGSGRVSRLLGIDPARWPFFSGRFRGVADAGGALETVEEATRLLASRGRLVLLAPGPDVARAVEAGPLEILASEPRALVARRP